MTRTRFYGTIVPASLIVLAVVLVVVIILAGGVLLGFIPYPGR